MSIWKKQLKLFDLNTRSKNTIVDLLGIKYIDFGDDFLVASMPVDHRHRQPMGIMHGGASCVLAESVGSTAAFLCIDMDQYGVGIDINTNHIRSIRSGFVRGTAKPFHIGSTTQVWGINITDEEDRLISVTRLTMAILKSK